MQGFLVYGLRAPLRRGDSAARALGDERRHPLPRDGDGRARERAARLHRDAERREPRQGARQGHVSKAVRYRWDDLPKEMLKPDLGRRLISTERMMLAHVYLEQGLRRARSTRTRTSSSRTSSKASSASGSARTSRRSSTSQPARCCTSRRTCRTGRRRSRRRSTSTSSVRRARTGSTARTRTSDVLARRRPSAGRSSSGQLPGLEVHGDAVVRELVRAVVEGDLERRRRVCYMSTPSTVRYPNSTIGSRSSVYSPTVTGRRAGPPCGFVAAKPPLPATT